MKLKHISPLYLASILTLSMADPAPAAATPGKPTPPPSTPAVTGEAAKVKFAKKEYDMDTGVLEITFGNGQVFEADSGVLSEEIRKNLMLHGLSQKLGDSYAGAKGNFAEAIASVKAVFESLKAGDWSTAGEEARPRLAELAEAIARIKKVDIAKATAAVEKATDDQRKSWRSNAQVKAMIAQARAEKAAKALAEAPKVELEVNLQ